MRRALRCRQLANALNLSTATGLLLAAVSRTPVDHGPDGLLFGTGYRPRLPVAGAFTVGSVIFYRADRAFIDSRPGLLKHEAAHATQYAWCLGLPFFALYGAAAAWSWWRTGDPGSRNVFERRAGLALGGYRELPAVHRVARLTAWRSTVHPAAFSLTRAATAEQSTRARIRRRKA